MQNILPVIDTHSIKHVINHIIPDSIFKKYISSLSYSGSSINLWTMTSRYPNDLLLYTNKSHSILTFRHCFQTSSSFNFHFSIWTSVFRIFYPAFAPHHATAKPAALQQFFQELFLLFLFYFFTLHCPIFSFTMGAISCICLHLEEKKV